MLDDLLEFALELGGAAVEAVAEHMWEKEKKPKREKQIKTGDSWKRKEKRPPWEE